MLVQPNEKCAPPKMLYRSGLDAVIWFNASTDVCQRRADGRRVDCDAGEKVYHVFDN